MSAPPNPVEPVEPRSLNAVMDAAAEILQRADAARLTVRLCGGLGCWYHAEHSRSVAEAANRMYGDVDLAAIYTERERVTELLRELGYREDAATGTIPGSRHVKFASEARAVGGDVFYDALEFCHRIDLRGRFERDRPTLPLAELLLQKLQVVDLAPKDVVDAQMLLLEHEFGNTDAEQFNAGRIAALCGSDWGLYQTVSANAEKVSAATAESAYLQQAQQDQVGARVERLRQILSAAPKSLRWRLRSVIGDRVQRYTSVDE